MKCTALKRAGNESWQKKKKKSHGLVYNSMKPLLKRRPAVYRRGTLSFFFFLLLLYFTATWLQSEIKCHTQQQLGVKRGKSFFPPL